MNNRKSLNDRILDATGGNERTVTISELTGKSDQEIAQMTDIQLTKLTEQALENLQDMAENNQEVTKLYVTGDDGKTHEIKVVPAALDSPESNVKNDGRAGSNIYQDGQQKKANSGFNSLGGIIKRNAIQNIIQAPGKLKQKIEQGVEKGVTEFGR